MSIEETLEDSLTAGMVRPGPKGGRRDTNRKQRFAEVQDAALTLFLDRGLDAVAIEDIAKSAGMAKSNFYRYAESKEALVEAILAPLRDEVFDAYDRCAADCADAADGKALTAAYMALAFQLLRTNDQHQRRVMLFLQEARGADAGPRQVIRQFERDVIARSIALTEIAHARGTLRKIPPHISAHIVVGAVERILLAYLRDHVFKNAAEVVQSLVRLVMEGIVD
jgi:AcrR family transcriptional regulator